MSRIKMGQTVLCLDTPRINYLELGFAIFNYLRGEHDINKEITIDVYGGKED